MLTVVPSRRVAAQIADPKGPVNDGLASRVAWTGEIVTLAEVLDLTLAADPDPRPRLGRVAVALLASEVLRDLEAEALRLFGPGVERAGAARAVAAAVAEVRSAGLAAVDLVPATNRSRRVAALASFVDAWERRLQRGDLLDEPAAVARATALIRAGAWPALPFGELEVHGLHDVTAVQGQLLLALARRADVVRVQVPFDAEDPDATRFAYPYVHLWESLLDPALDVELRFFDREDPVPQIELHPATDPADEARQVAARVRRWVDEGVPPEEIAVVLPGPFHRIDALARELGRRGVVHHARRRAALPESPAVAAALLPFALIDGGLPRERIEAWVASPLTAALDPDLLLPVVGRGPAEGGTREEWNRALTVAKGEPAARLVAALGAIHDLARAESAPADFWSRYGDILSRVGLLDGMAERDPPGLAAWEAAVLELRRAHESLGSWAAPARGWRVHRRGIHESLAGRGSLGRTGRGVEILTAREARGLCFRRQALVGLVQGALSRPSAAAAVLGDPERRELNDALGRAVFRTSAEESLEGDLLLAERIRATGELVAVSWPVEDGNGAPLLPALEVERERERRGSAVPEAPTVAEPPAWRSGREAVSVAALQRIELERTSFFAAPPETRRANADRWSGGFDDAAVAALVEEFAGGATSSWSASGLDTWSGCGHQWFQRYLLRLRPPDARPLEAEPGTTGDLAHLALKALFSSGRGPWSIEDVDAAVDAAGREIPDHRRGPSTVWDLTRRRVAATIHRYLEECAAGGDDRETVAVEVPFGGEGSTVPAVEIATRHGPVSLRGKIDRIDREGDTLHIIDYKYAIRRKAHAEAVDPARCGIDRFQLHAYYLGSLERAESLDETAPASVTGAIHCVRSRDVLGPLEMPDPETVRAGIARAVEAVAEGIFDPSPRDPDGCRYCDFRRSCRIATVPGAAPEADEGAE